MVVRRGPRPGRHAGDHARRRRRPDPRARHEPIEVKAAAGVSAVEPTGVGDAFRAGFLAGLEWELGHERSAQIGCVLAAYVVETVGTQEYSFTAEQFVERIRLSYGDTAADEVGARLT